MGSLSSELKRVRGIKGVSLRDVEKATGISNAYLSQLERGDAKNPSLNKLTKIALYYGVSLESLLESGATTASNKSRPTEIGDKMYSGSRSKNGNKSVLREALLSAQLDDEEAILVAEYIAFLKTRRKTK